MLCQICNKKNATVHYTKIINGESQAWHLCEECAMSNNEFELDTAFSFHKLLTGLIDSIQGGPVEEEADNIVCETCGLSYSKFKQLGKFGCPSCYDSFKIKLLPLVKGIHGHTRHMGKIPKRANKDILKRRKIEKMRMELDKLVCNEAFEDAAILRDEIRELERELDG